MNHLTDNAVLTQLNGGAPVECMGMPVSKLPLLYRSLYQLSRCVVRGVECLMAEDKMAMRLTPAVIAKHMQVLSELFGMPSVYVAPRVSSQDALRLMAKNAPFIAGNGNLYMPFLGARLRAVPRVRPVSAQLNAAAQLLVLAVLHHRVPLPLTYERARIFLGVSQGSLHSALAQLQDVGLFVSRHAEAASRCLALQPLATGRELWERALPLLQNPCRRCIETEFLPRDLDFCAADETALAERTLLAAPATPVYAVALRDYRRRAGVEADLLLGEAEAPKQLQLWLYAPTFIHGDRADDLSLYLTLRSHPDERVQQALESLLLHFPW